MRLKQINIITIVLLVFISLMLISAVASAAVGTDCTKKSEVCDKDTENCVTVPGTSNQKVCQLKEKYAPWGTGGDLEKPVQAGGVSTTANLIALISQALKWAQYFLYSGAAILGIMAAYQFLTSRGDAEKTKGAQNTILYAIIAVVVGLIAGGISSVIKEMFGN